MLKPQPTRLTLKQDDLKELEEARAKWIAQKEQKSVGDMEMQEGSKSLTATSNIGDANALDTRRNRIGVGLSNSR